MSDAPTPIFDRAFISNQHGRRSPIDPKYRFLFDPAEKDALDRLDFLKEKAKTVALHGRRFFKHADTQFHQHARFKTSPHEDFEFIDNADDLTHFDAVISLFSLHAANDVQKVLNELKNKLTDKGMFVGCVFGAKTLPLLRQALATAEQDIRGTAGARIYPFAEAPAWVGQLQNAGYALPVADSELITVHYKSLRGMLTDLRMMGEANGMVNRPRTGLTPAIIDRAEVIYKELANDENGLLPATYEIIWLQGFKS